MLKRAIVRSADLLGAFPIGHALAARRGGYVRAINYHATPAEHADGFRRQLDLYRRHFENCDRALLDATLAGRDGRPAILISFDDGFRSNYDVAAPLLEEAGFTGWFFVSSGRLRGAPGDEGAPDSRAPDKHPCARYPDGTHPEDFMSPDELRDLVRRGHVVGCHTHSHVQLSADLPPERLADEIITGRARLAEILGTEVDTFCWVGGEEWAYSASAQRVIEAERFRYAFMTNLEIVTGRTHPLWIQRTNVEAHWSMPYVRFYLSGLMDVAYDAKRRRIAARLSP